MSFKLKKILFSVIILSFSLPLLQFHTRFSKEAKLKGSFKVTSKPEEKQWFTGDYQAAYSAYYDNRVGFKTFITRSYNQIQYSLYDKVNAKDVEVGKEGYLFEGGYIRDYMGYNFLGKEKIDNKLKEIKLIQEELKKDSVILILALAPGKASYFPEYFPEKYDTSKKTMSNYLYYAQQCKKMKLNYIDFNVLFLDLKKKGETRLFPKGGIHWGEYGIALALKQLTSKLEKESSLDLMSYSIEGFSYPKKTKHVDRDISDAMNLLFKLSDYKMKEPIFKFYENQKHTKPNILIVGDSFGYGFYYSEVSKKLFNRIELWYYNKVVISEMENRGTSISEINYKKELKAFDCIILLAAEATLYKMDFGFADNYFNNKDFKQEVEIKKIIKRIKNDSIWFESVKKSAEERSITIEEALRKSAIFVINNRKDKEV